MFQRLTKTICFLVLCGIVGAVTHHVYAFHAFALGYLGQPSTQLDEALRAGSLFCLVGGLTLRRRSHGMRGMTGGILGVLLITAMNSPYLDLLSTAERLVLFTYGSAMGGAVSLLAPSLKARLDAAFPTVLKAMHADIRVPTLLGTHNKIHAPTGLRPEEVHTEA